MKKIAQTKPHAQAGFTYLTDPRVDIAIQYVTPNNFTGRIVQGYQKNVCILTHQAAQALISVQNALAPNQSLRIFDAYRPTDAVADFLSWANESDESTKSLFYPRWQKHDLFHQGYLATHSAHSRGSTVDLTILENGTELDMGTRFDFFDVSAHTDYPDLSAEAHKNRQWLQTLMHDHGFSGFSMEWWHFTLNDEPFPSTDFNFPVA